jgi:hypothetical protein
MNHKGAIATHRINLERNIKMLEVGLEEFEYCSVPPRLLKMWGERGVRNVYPAGKKWELELARVVSRRVGTREK